MANEKISELIPAFALTGFEEVPIVQSGSTVRTTVQDIAALAGGGGTANYGVAKVINVSGSPSSTYDFNTLFPTVLFMNVAVSMQMQIIMSSGQDQPNYGSILYNVVRSNSGSPMWNYSSAYSSQMSGMVSPSFMFSGSAASPTLQFYISGGQTLSAIMTIITV